MTVTDTVFGVAGNEWVRRIEYMGAPFDIMVLISDGTPEHMCVLFYVI